jgi:Predicted HD superfamily hydrolase involved in NAD metabolism
MDPAGLAAEVRRRVSPGRFAHVEGVVQAAAELARRWGVAEDKAVLAAWLHDVAKELPQDTLLKLADRFGIIFDDEMAHMPHLWHAPVGRSWRGGSSASAIRTCWRPFATTPRGGRACHRWSASSFWPT